MTETESFMFHVARLDSDAQQMLTSFGKNDVICDVSCAGVVYRVITHGCVSSLSIAETNQVMLELVLTLVSGELPSVFTVENYPEKRSYCNNNRPPGVIYSSTETLIVTFNRRTERSFIQQVEGFRFIYRTESAHLNRILSDIQIGFTTECAKKFKKCYMVNFGTPRSWISAAEQCHNTQTTLVSIHSREEMDYVIYLLQKHGEIPSVKWRNLTIEEPSAHIGLYHYITEDGKRMDIWDNKEHVIFTAWNAGHPTIDSCTRMNFRRFDTNTTWVSEDCFNGISEFYVCEEAYRTKRRRSFEDDTCDINGWMEAGSVNRTLSGIPCQYWNTQSTHKHAYNESKFFNYISMDLVGNSCQDPDGSGYLWCFTTGDDVIKEQCLLSQDDANEGENIPTISTKPICVRGSSEWTLIRCDGKFDCDDKSDESSCEDVTRYHYLFINEANHTITTIELDDAFYFQCLNSEWISILSRCDDVIDCLDASDELDCFTSRQGCSVNEFACEDGTCIDVNRVCDYTSDCDDDSDEFCITRQCKTNEFTCDNGECISQTKRCDAKTNCVDLSDEQFCDSCQNSFHCDAIRCIPSRLVCDNYGDCEDGKDENSCSEKIFESCEDRWENGFRTSGLFNLQSYASKVYCDFSAVDDDKKMRMSLPNTDLIADFKVSPLGSSIERLSFLTSGLEGWSDVIRAIIQKYACFTEIKVTCVFAQQKAYSVINTEQGERLPYCGCTVFHLENDVFRGAGATFLRGSHRPCNGSKLMTEEGLHKDPFVDGIIIESSRDRFHFFFPVEEWPIQAKLARIECTKEYNDNTQQDSIECDGNQNLIPSGIRCIYDIDETGYRYGCRSGSHLANCDTFVCPEGTVKCPGSYCIPQGFVCDGEKQCPGGTDEEDCYCTQSKREVIIIVEDSEQQRESTKAAISLANKLYSTDSIVRLLKYTPFQQLYTFEHRALDIKEERIVPYFRFKQPKVCNYKTFASNFLKYVNFTKPDVNGIVFIEDSLESSKVGSLMFSKIRRAPDFKIYRVIRNANIESHRLGKYNYVTDVHIRRWNVLSSIGYRHFPEICNATTEIPCSGKYRCATSKQCLSVDKICDGVLQCIHGDDEHFCDLACPAKCNCNGYILDCRDSALRVEDVEIVPTTIRSADFSKNHHLSSLLSNDHLNFQFLLYLNLSNCNIKVIKQIAFSKLQNLLTLDISYNNFSNLPANGFIYLKQLSQLKLDGNFLLQSISPAAFAGLTRLKYLKITGTKLRRIASYTFSGLNLQFLDITNNELQELEGYAFGGLSVENIYFEGNDIQFNKDTFVGVLSLRVLRTPAYKYCCIRPNYVDERNCYPSKDEFSSCEDLMRLSVLQTILWLVGIAAIIGNVGSIVYRLVYDRERLKIGHGIFVTNLAFSDFLMGVYLIVIAVADSMFRKRYIYMDDYWRNSAWCTIAGILAFVSSEASVLFVCLITIDRLIVIKYPFGQIRLSPKKAHICCLVAWCVSAILAVIPVLHSGYFENKFYSRSGVCVALPLTRDQPPGWEYSVTISVGLNFCTFILVALGQLSIFMELRKSKTMVGRSKTSRDRDLQVARNLILVATTDFLCWFPIGVMGLMALNGYPIPGDVYAWTVVFILPFNSALNPFLYTVTAILGKKSFNPRAREQIGEEYIKEFGSRILQYQAVSRQVKMKQDGRFVETGIHNLEQVQGVNDPPSLITAVTFTRRLARYLRVLHESYIVIDELSINKVKVAVDEDKKCRCIVIVSKTHLASDENEARNNMYQFGVILRKLLSRQ